MSVNKVSEEQWLMGMRCGAAILMAWQEGPTGKNGCELLVNGVEEGLVGLNVSVNTVSQVTKTELEAGQRVNDKQITMKIVRLHGWT